MPAGDARTRFGNRVADYARSRPAYPPEVIETLIQRCGLGVSTCVADLGAGTGIFTRQLLQTGATVHAIEPNHEMRAMLLGAPGESGRLVVHNGSAEHTELEARSVDLVTAAQAFHWFEPDALRLELQRILRPQGWVALLWNARRETDTPFLCGYERLLRRYSPDYLDVKHQNVDEQSLQAFFAPARIEKYRFANRQDFDWEGLTQRVLSSSYVPSAGEPGHAPLLAELQALFDQCQAGGRVAFLYDTELYLAQPAWHWSNSAE